MKKLIFVFISLSIYLLANETTVLKTRFYSNVNQNVEQQIKNIVKKDKYYHLAIEYLTEPSMTINRKFITNDPEELEDLSKEERKAKIRTKTVSLPNYPAALKEFQKSVNAYSNPLSAYIAMYIIKTKIPARTIKEIKMKRKYSELLYKTTHLCSAYIDYSDILMNGIGGKTNLDKAYAVLKEAKKCYPSASDWQKQIIEMKISRVKLLKKNQ